MKNIFFHFTATVLLSAQLAAQPVQQNFITEKNRILISTQALPNGIYIVRLKNNDGWLKAKLAVMH